MVGEADETMSAVRRRRIHHQPVLGVEAGGGHQRQHDGEDHPPRRLPPAGHQGGATRRRPVVGRAIVIFFFLVLLLICWCSGLLRLRGAMIGGCGGGGGLGLLFRRRQLGHGDVEDAVPGVEPGADVAGVAVIGDLEILVEAAPPVAGDLPLAAYPQLPVVVDLHSQLLLLEPCNCTRHPK